MRVGWIALSALLIAGCSGSHPATPSPAPVAKLPADPWILSCNDPNIKTPALLWNGLIGVRIGRDGTGIDDYGFFSVDQYGAAPEEKILAMHNPLEGSWRVKTLSGSNVSLLPVGARDYRQSLDMRTGMLSTSWSQIVDGDAVHIINQTVMATGQSYIAQRWTIQGGKRQHLFFREGLHAEGTVKPKRVRHAKKYQWTYQWSANKRPLLASYGFSENSGEFELGDSGASMDVSTDQAQSCTLDRVFYLPKLGSDVRSAVMPSFENVAQASAKVWTDRWKTDIEIDGPVEDQQAVHSFLFYLRSAISPEGKMSISPFGLSDATYNGHVFWDADIWVFSALDLIDPEAARAITDYRTAHLHAARDNYEQWINANRPTGGDPLGPMPKGIPPWQPGIKYPWESSVTGKETVPGPSKFEDHITGSVYHAMRDADRLDLATPSELSDIARGGTEFYTDRIVKRSDGTYDLPATMSPDENHIGGNDLYTNILAQEVIGDGLWKMPAKYRYKLHIPRDDKSLLTYDDDALRGYKQAAAVLAIYPLQYPEAEKEAAVMMDRFADKVGKNGPAMSDSVHSVIWSRIGQPEKAYESWRNSWQPFTAHPLMLFSEKRSKDTCYFTTGAAGSLQSVLYGFLGFRLDWKKQEGAAWSLPLKGGSWLSVKPHLPPAWKGVKFKNFSALGRRYTLTVTPAHVTVSKGD